MGPPSSRPARTIQQPFGGPRVPALLERDDQFTRSGGRTGGLVEPRGRSLPGTDDGQWHQIVIAVYPSPVAMMTMLAQPKYRAAHLHREAGLVRTRLLATQPLEAI